MRRSALLLTVALAATTIATAFAQGVRPADPSAGGANAIKLTGTYLTRYDPGVQHTVTAVLTPTGQNEYKAVYTFDWKKSKQVWNGTLTGNLRDGAVSCTAATPDGRRRFVMRATAAQGVVKGQTFELKGKDDPTGTIEWRL